MKPEILIIEPDEGMGMLLYNFLNENKFKANLQKNGLQALKWLYEGNMPDLIITEINIPKLDGNSLCKKLSTIELFNHIPIIAITDTSNNQPNAQFETILNKPVDLINLLHRIYRLKIL
ncbi:response regulator [Flexithrix dorotheae]|uniref:response regulator n=1 Tax=Flexithrix dorotheae TaxID=70993 RepID=UPI000363DF68|nr:response regulator [Flexithrix dorotheae]